MILDAYAKKKESNLFLQIPASCHGLPNLSPHLSLRVGVWGTAAEGQEAKFCLLPYASANTTGSNLMGCNLFIICKLKKIPHFCLTDDVDTGVLANMRPGQPF